MSNSFNAVLMEDVRRSAATKVEACWVQRLRHFSSARVSACRLKVEKLVRLYIGRCEELINMWCTYAAIRSSASYPEDIVDDDIVSVMMMACLYAQRRDVRV